MSAATSRASNRAHSDSLGRYFTEIMNFPLLARDQETELAYRIQAGERAAFDRLVCANLRFVVAIAKHYRHQGLPLADLINDGNIGLMRAAERYDPEKGVRFITYAVWWIRQAIVCGLSENAHTVRVPNYRAGAVYRLGRRVNALRHALGREPSPREIADELKLSSDEVGTALQLACDSLSLDAPAKGESDLRLEDVLADETTAIVDHATIDEGLTKMIQSAVATLPDREALVLRLYFGIDGAGEPMPLEHIGRQLGVTRERARQVKERALAHLRSSRVASALEVFMTA